MRCTAVVSMFVVAISSMLVGVARADEPTAADHIDRAGKLYEAHEYAKAATELEAAHAIDPRPELLYNAAQAWRLAGDCTTALLRYDEFLATKPPEADAKLARENIERCRAIVERHPKAQQPSPPPPPPPPPPVRSSFFRDPVAMTLWGTGTIAASVGGAFWAIGRNNTRKANEATTYDEFAAHAHGETQQKLGAAGIALGGALVVGGIVKWVIAPRTHVVVEAKLDGRSSFFASGSIRW